MVPERGLGYGSWKPTSRLGVVLFVGVKVSSYLEGEGKAKTPSFLKNENGVNQKGSKRAANAEGEGSNAKNPARGYSVVRPTPNRRLAWRKRGGEEKQGGHPGLCKKKKVPPRVARDRRKRSMSSGQQKRGGGGVGVHVRV